MFTVYILTCADGSYHSGVTKDLDARLAYHENGENESAFTFSRRPVQLVYQKSFDGIREAIAFEKELQLKTPAEMGEIVAGRLAVQTESFAVQKTNKTANQTIILPTSYLGNLAYLAQLKANQQVIIDISERFQKQSYRSRCAILSANGLQNLVVPLIRPNGKETLMCDVLISYTENWVKNHIKAIESAYRKAPFYEYYAEDLFAIFEKKHKRLIHFNWDLTLFLIKSFGLNTQTRFSELHEKSSIASKNELLPKARTNYKAKPYHQVFNNGEFENNISMIDLLFNCGKDGLVLLT